MTSICLNLVAHSYLKRFQKRHRLNEGLVHPPLLRIVLHNEPTECCSVLTHKKIVFFHNEHYHKAYRIMDHRTPHSSNSVDQHRHTKKCTQFSYYSNLVFMNIVYFFEICILTTFVLIGSQMNLTELILNHVRGTWINSSFRLQSVISSVCSSCV